MTTILSEQLFSLLYAYSMHILVMMVCIYTCLRIPSFMFEHLIIKQNTFSSLNHLALMVNYLFQAWDALFTFKIGYACLNQKLVLIHLIGLIHV